MKSNRGVTLTSLIIYIIGLSIVIGTLSIVSRYFYKNINKVALNQTAQEEYSKLLSYLTKDVNDENIILIQSGVNDLDCIIFKFKDGTEHQYMYYDSVIYYISVDNANEKKIVLCSDVSEPSEEIFKFTDGKIEIKLNINGENFSTILNQRKELN